MNRGTRKEMKNEKMWLIKRGLNPRKIQLKASVN